MDSTLTPTKYRCKENILRILQEERKLDFISIGKHGQNVLTLPFENENLTEKDIIDVLEYLYSHNQGVYANIGNEIGGSALLKTATNSLNDAVDFLIKRQGKVNKIDRGGNTITHHLVEDLKLKYDQAFSSMSDAGLEIIQKRSENFVEWLITKGFDFECKNRFGETALSMSLAHNLQHITLVLLKYAKHVYSVNIGQSNLLHQFFNLNGSPRKKHPNIETGTYFMNFDNTYPVIEIFGQNCDKIEAEEWQEFDSRYASTIVKILLDKGVSAVAFDKTRTTPLWMAVVKGEALEIIDMLLDRSVWSNHQQSNEVATTVLIELFRGCKWWGDESRTNYFLKVVRTLIAEGANVNAKNPLGKTAVYYAFQGQHRRAIDVLNQNGADFYSILCDDGRNLFHVLADSKQSSDEGQQEALFDLLASKACCNVNATDRFARTPLHCAAQAANWTIARKLIQHGADVNAKDSDGSTALHLAVGSREKEEDKLVELLLTSGAEVNLKNHSGKRPLACVSNFTSRSSVSLLLKWGALVNDYRNGESIFSRVFVIKGFGCAREMLAYGLDIHDSRICAFFKSQVIYDSGLLTGFFSKHWIKHEVAKLPCSDYYKFYSKDHVTDREYEECCLREVAKLKNTFIDSKKSLYDYLQLGFESRFIYNHNEKLKNLVNRPDLLEQEFAEYSVLILARYRNAVRWKSLLEPAKEAWLRLTHIALPDICIERIFAHLKMDELAVFID